MSIPFDCTTCNGSGTDVESARDFIRMILARGHESVIEHASAGFLIVTDRGVTHEIVRHRLASYSQCSTRYCNYSKEQFGGEIAVIEPPDLEADAMAYWHDVMRTCESQYLNMTKEGCKPEIARSVLPNSLKSEIGMTANFREWRHFLRLRTSPKAHPQMREIAEMIRAELLKISRACFEDIP
jgi:thymidylate synthase (FAD)